MTRKICSSGLPASRITSDASDASDASTIAAGQREPAQPEPAGGGSLSGGGGMSKKPAVILNAAFGGFATKAE